MLRALAIVTVIPVSVGMIARVVVPTLARWLLEPLRRVTLIMLLFVIVGATLSGYEAIRENFVRAGLVVVASNSWTIQSPNLRCTWGWGWPKSRRADI